jgi:hypothetical protein
MRQTSRYFSALTEAFLAEGGTVDKVVGDAVMVFWNAPDPQPDHVAHACRAALSAEAAGERLNAEFEAEGLTAFFTRFGIHVGEAVVGNVGSTERMNYTALGNTETTSDPMEATLIGFRNVGAGRHPGRHGRSERGAAGDVWSEGKCAKRLRGGDAHQPPSLQTGHDRQAQFRRDVRRGLAIDQPDQGFGLEQIYSRKRQTYRRLDLPLGVRRVRRADIQGLVIDRRYIAAQAPRPKIGNVPPKKKWKFLFRYWKQVEYRR